MKIAEVHKLELKSDFPPLEEISVSLDQQKERLLIDTINWKGYNYKPDVALSIAYSDHEIFLKYYITENYFKAEKTGTNEMVCEDSCVEFFVSPEDDGIYYNMEFNGIGTCLAEGTSVTVHREEHFRGYNLALSCSGAPILDPHGGVMAVLDASTANSSDSRLIQRHTMALVNMSANLISRPSRTCRVSRLDSLWQL